jgi:hypothetical protein
VPRERRGIGLHDDARLRSARALHGGHVLRECVGIPVRRRERVRTGIGVCRGNVQLSAR